MYGDGEDSSAADDDPEATGSADESDGNPCTGLYDTGTCLEGSFPLSQRGKNLFESKVRPPKVDPLRPPPGGPLGNGWVGVLIVG